MSSQSFMWLAFGVAALVVALALAAVLIRLRGTLGAVEELLETTNEELKETLPEVRQTIGNVNDITAGVNVGLRTAGGGVAAVGRSVSAAAPHDGPECDCGSINDYYYARASAAKLAMPGPGSTVVSIPNCNSAEMIEIMKTSIFDHRPMKSMRR